MRLIERMAYDVGRVLFDLGEHVTAVRVVVSKDILENTSRISAALELSRADLSISL